jgi:class 3 adenylate cyclase/tetratricopeptide (TPR) repeat protein
MFCDLVGSTALSEQLDPEELREVVRTYQGVSAAVITRFEGHIAQYLGDGLLVYFGYPGAHEDDAQRAVQTALGILVAIHQAPLLQQHGVQVRLGIHTGQVVVGEIGGGAKREHLALGETPNLAARVQGVAEPDTVVISAATYRLVHGLFEFQDLGPQTLKGISTPLSLYRVVRESQAQSRFEVAIRTGLTPLIGREHEVGLLQDRWAQAKGGTGQVVLLSGEAGIGKSRLVQTLKEHVLSEDATRIEFRCSPYYQNSALYPLIEHLQRLLQFHREESPQAKLEKLQQALARYHFPQADTLPLLAALLSLPHPEGAPPLTLSPQKQKQKTQAAVVAWLVEEAEKAAVYCIWEDLHWADPSTLEVLSLLLDQVPTARFFLLLTFRPEFSPPWGSRAYLTPLVLSRLPRTQAEEMVEKVTGGKTLPAEVFTQIVRKTDGVPLFVEELTKMVIESVGSIESIGSVGSHNRTLLQAIAIPATLHDSLMARLDRLGPAKEVAQMGATVGREFSYELLQAVAPVEEASLQQALRQLVEAELVYQRGVPPQSTYLFKHALVQDTAYQSLLKSTRQQYHKQIAHVLEGRFPETTETQPELLAHHYTEAGLTAQAIPYWQQAGQRAVQRSAHAEAVAHLARGLDLLKTLPDTPEHIQQELTLQVILGTSLIATKGYGASEVEQAYNKARRLCQRVGETPQLFPALSGLWMYYLQQANLQTAGELGDQLLVLAESQHAPTLLLAAHRVLGTTAYWRGEFIAARDHMEQGFALYDLQRHHTPASRYGAGNDPVVSCLSYTAWALWHLGYPDQALQKSHEMLALARDLSHPFTLAWALNAASWARLYRREGQAAYTLADEAIALSITQDFPHWLAMGLEMRGKALIELGQWEEGTAQLQQGIEAYRATGSVLGTRGGNFAELARGHGYRGRVEEGLRMLAEALATADKTGECYYKAEMYRLKGTLTLQSKVPGPKSIVEEAEEC